jgi:glycosyltransferase involved in cell wall biosynthesis/O-antigen/teichoic acid export membrane protein
MTVLDAHPAPAVTAAEAPARTLRILHVINMGVVCGGAERLVADLVTVQRAEGHAVRVLSSDRPGSGVPFGDVTWAQSSPTGIAGRFAGMVRNPAARAALAEQVTTWQPDVVHLHTIGLLSPSSLSVLRDVPTVLTLHGPELFLRSTERWCMPATHFRPGSRCTPSWRGWLALLFFTLLAGPLWRRRLRVVDVHLAPSDYLADLASRDFSPTRVVPNGFTPSDVARRPHTDGRTRVVFAGRLEHFKGPQILLDAIPALRDTHPDARFTICGAGPALADLTAQIDRLGLGDVVELTGWLPAEQLQHRIADADVVVVPSMWPEAFGLTCLEAFAAGTPVVASAIGALPELVETEVTGLLVPPGDAGALSAAVDRLLADPALRTRLGENGRARSAAYGIRAHGDAVDEAYRPALARPALARPALARPALSRPAGTSWLSSRVRAVREDSLVRNSAVLLLATIVLAGGGFLFWQMAAQLFTPAQIGQASALISMSTLLANVALLGMNNSLIRYLGHWSDPARTVNSGVVLVAGAAALGALVFVAGSPVFAPRVADALDTPKAVAFGLLTVAGALGMLYDNVFIALRRTGQILGRNVVVVVLRLLLPLALISAGGFGVFTAYWLAFAVALVPYLAVLRRTYRLRARPSLRRLRDMWSYSIGTHTATIILMLPTLLMPTLVAQRVGLEAAGFYYVASLVASVLLFVPQAAGRSLFAEAYHDGGHTAEHLPRVLRLTALVQTPILLVVIGLGRPLLRVFGEEYTHAYPLLVLLAVANALTSVGYVGSTLLLISGRTRLLVVLSAVAYAIAVVGGWALATHGLVWIGAALVAGELVLAAGYLRIIHRALRETP